MGSAAFLRVAPGAGMLARRESAALFVPIESETAGNLVAAFRQAEAGTEIDAVTQFAAESEFRVESFLVIDWADDVRLALFGSVEVHSNHRSMPRLSGAGFDTWVERTIRADDVELQVSAADVHPGSDLQLGTVSAGGFVLSVVGSPSSASSGSAAKVQPRPEPSQPPPAPEVPAPPRVPFPGPAGGVVETDPARRVASSLLGTRSSGESLDMMQQVSGRDDLTIDVPPELLRPAHDGSQPGQDGEGTWQLRFADGTIESVDRTLILGRKPTIDANDDPAAVRTVQLDCQLMSSRHISVRTDSSGIWLTDLRSRNRSWVVTSGDHKLVALEPDVPTRLEHGTHVQVGTKVFIVERATP